MSEQAAEPGTALDEVSGEDLESLIGEPVEPEHDLDTNEPAADWGTIDSGDDVTEEEAGNG